MKLIEALKGIKDLARKAEDLRTKVATYSAHMNFETPTYPDQKKQVSEWIQSHGDVLKEILRLRIAIQRTNIETEVTIELDGENVKKSIAGWIHRRRDIAKLEQDCWQKLTDKGLREGNVQKSDGSISEVKIVRCYDPVERDKQVASLSSEPSIIDGKLEITNAVTDLLE
jgi:hypothetical protein